MIEQEARGVVVEVVDGDHERRDAVGIRLVDVRAGFEHCAHAAAAAGTSGVEQGREPARRAVLRARLGGDLRLPVVRGGAHAYIRAFRNQQQGELGKIAVGGPHERRLSAPRLSAFTFAPCSTSVVATSSAPARAASISAVWPSSIRRLGVRARVEQQVDELRVAELHGLGERARSVVVHDVRFRAALRAAARRAPRPPLDGPVQRRRAIALSRVHVAPARIASSAAPRSPAGSGPPIRPRQPHCRPPRARRRSTQGARVVGWTLDQPKNQSSQ